MTTTYADVDRLVSRQHGIWNRMEEIRQRAAEEGRDWTAEERTNWDAADADLNTVTGDIERLTRFSHLDTTNRSNLVETTEDRQEDTDEERERQFSGAFSNWLRGGMDFCTPEQRQHMARAQSEARAYQSVSTPSAGGYLVPDGFRKTMTETLKAFGGLMNYANVIQTSTGNTLSWPSNDDTGNVGAILAENTQITEQAATFGTKSIGAYTYTSKLVRVSVQLLQDSVFDLDTWLPRKLGERIGRAVADDLVNGTGTGEPTGALPTSTQGATETDDNLFNTDGGFLYPALVDLEHSVDPAYRALGDTRYVLSDGTLSLVRKQTDTLLRPIWLPVPVPGQPATINGQPYSIDQAMPTATNTVASKPIMFGNFNAGFLVRQSLDVQAIRLTERYADYLQVGFFGFMRIDATPDDTSAYKHLAMST